jgi:osmoprotectant transport system substrate-binding protein
VGSRASDGRVWWKTHRLVAAATAAASLVLAACSSGSSPTPMRTVTGDRAITVASFDFAESEVLGELYGIALERAGFDVRFARRLGPRELVDPALARGLVELVPEYAGTALQFLSLGEAEASPNVLLTHAALERTLRGSGLVALDPARAQDTNAIVVTPRTALEHDLRTISDLADVDPPLTFGGPPECPNRPLCLLGLRRIYGLRVKSFLPLDTGGPLTRQAVEQGQVDVALMFSTEPALVNAGLVSLTDDRSLQPAENITPIVHRSVVRRFGDRFARVVNRVSRALTTSDLRALNAQVAAGTSPSEAAAGWLTKAERR